MCITKVRPIKQFCLLFILSSPLSIDCSSGRSKKAGLNLLKVSRSTRKAVKRLWELSYLRDLEIESSKTPKKIKEDCKQLKQLAHYAVQHEEKVCARNILCGLALQRMFEDLK